MKTTFHERDAFVTSGQPRWRSLERLLRAPKLTAGQISELAGLYRSVCADLSRAAALGLGDDVVHYLDGLASRAHNRLYAPTLKVRSRWLAVVFSDVPRRIRSSWRFMLAAALLFYGPYVVGIVGALLDPGFALAVLPESQLASMESMYSDEVLRGAGDDMQMAGFYVYNNIGIAFRCFATGFFGGLGSIFYLVYNGLVLGTVTGWITAAGHGRNLLDFTAGHSAWELNGIVVGGAAGLRLGWALVVTEGRTRIGSLRAAAPELFELVLGATVMIAIAAAIEGFWSASPVPFSIKLVFGALQCAVVAIWWGFGGRGGAA